MVRVPFVEHVMTPEFNSDQDQNLILLTFEVPMVKSSSKVLMYQRVSQPQSPPLAQNASAVNPKM